MSWIKKQKLNILQLEISNYCNAACPLCEREWMDKKLLNNNFMTLKEFQSIFKGGWDELSHLIFCGGLDDPVINPDFISMIKFLASNSNLVKSNRDSPNIFKKLHLIDISTNGGPMSESFWKELGELSSLYFNNGVNITVTFGIDGLEDTNHMYRKNVKWKLLERNFRAYIDAGGIASWQFIPFPWNLHQRQECQLVAAEEGFTSFFMIDSIRETVW